MSKLPIGFSQEAKPLSASEKWAAYEADMAWSMDDGA